MGGRRRWLCTCVCGLHNLRLFVWPTHGAPITPVVDHYYKSMLTTHNYTENDDVTLSCYIRQLVRHNAGLTLAIIDRRFVTRWNWQIVRADLYTWWLLSDWQQFDLVASTTDLSSLSTGPETSNDMICSLSWPPQNIITTQNASPFLYSARRTTLADSLISTDF